MPDKLSIYNGALRLCEERKLSTLTDASEARRLLDTAWDGGDAIDYCLELGQWTFATRSAMVDYTPSVEPDFGYEYAFTQPTDMVRPVAICSDEYFEVPLLRYADERKYWYCDLPTIYVRWVSNGDTYGHDLSLWSQQFAKLVEAYLASEIVGNLTTKDGLVERVAKVFAMQKRDAKSLDAMNKPTVFTPDGAWSSARAGRDRRGSRWNGRWSD